MLEIVNQNAQDALKKFHINNNKEHGKTLKQINEFRKDFNKCQSETIKREIYELKMTTQNVKEEFNKHIEKP
jgi:phage-related protein